MVGRSSKIARSLGVFHCHEFAKMVVNDPLNSQMRFFLFGFGECFCAIYKRIQFRH